MANREQQGTKAERRERFLAMAGLIGRFGAGAFTSSKPQQLNITTGELTVAGIVMHNRKSLEKLRAAGTQLELNVTGILRLADNVTPELACAVIKSLKVCGAFHASAEVKAALLDRML